MWQWLIDLFRPVIRENNYDNSKYLQAQPTIWDRDLRRRVRYHTAAFTTAAVASYGHPLYSSNRGMIITGLDVYATAGVARAWWSVSSGRIDDPNAGYMKFGQETAITLSRIIELTDREIYVPPGAWFNIGVTTGGGAAIMTADVRLSYILLEE